MVIATNRYVSFVPDLAESARKFFLTDHDVTIIVFTDGEVPDGVVKVHQDHEVFPGPALHKLHYLQGESERLEEFDYVYLCDADMRLVDVVGDEIIGDLVATRHSRYLENEPGTFPYERDLRSSAYIEKGKGTYYFQTAFFGGRTGHFLNMVDEVVPRIDRDTASGLTARWWDESHINRYLVDHPPAVALPPEYCYPENTVQSYPPRIVELDKDDDQVRSISIFRRLKTNAAAAKSKMLLRTYQLFRSCFRGVPGLGLLRRRALRKLHREQIAVWEQNGSPSPPPHVVKQRALKESVERFGLSAMVECRTYYGTMVQAMRGVCDQIYSIESDRALFENASRRFRRDRSVELVHGDSRIELGKLVPRIGTPSLFWLNSSYSGELVPDGGDSGDYPIYQELRHIMDAGARRHVVVIDDARCFGTNPHYPSLEELGGFVRSKWPDANIVVEYDSVRIAPGKA